MGKKLSDFVFDLTRMPFILQTAGDPFNQLDPVFSFPQKLDTYIGGDWTALKINLDFFMKKFFK
ncbi:hypothetical protein JW992_14920, partial [candidate division KSB1 bacterium]|nr:hypothetical protein [candidate division KSB1 bacterium]